MPNLAARFTLAVSAPCLLSWPEGALPPQFTVPYENFQVTVRLLPTEDWRSKEKDNACWTTGIRAMDITVFRNESELPPDIIITPEGGRDLTVQGKYLRSKLPQYKDAALEVSNHILRFFQYSLCTPLVRPTPRWDQALNNPIWFGSSGAELSGSPYTVMAQPVPGLYGELGAKKLTPKELSALVDYAVKPQEPSLSETLLSAAQSAFIEGNLRRSVLELAICTEVMVKRRFFPQASPAGSAFDYLEDKAKLSVRVLDLLDVVSEEAFSGSYRKQEADNFQRIDYLFRCRNKIAHRGELAFRDDSGKIVNVEASLVETWWHAVANLKAWLEIIS